MTAASDNYYKLDNNIYVITNYLPFPLKSCNCYLAESKTGFSIIDCGVNLEVNRNIWQQVIKDIGISFKDIHRIYLTHYHHDHIGLAGWIQQLSGALVYLSPTDILSFQNNIVIPDAGTDQVPARWGKSCLEAGWEQDLVLELAADLKSITGLAMPFPELTPLYHEDPVYFGGDVYNIIPVPGHSDGHNVFYCPQSRILIAGDTMVDHTILHITDWPFNSRHNIKAEHLKALNSLPAADIELTLSGHGLPIRDIKAKIFAINKHHEKRQEKVWQGLTRPCTPWELAQQVFKSDDYIHIKRLILAETLVYLEALEGEGVIKSELKEIAAGLVYEYSR